MNDESGIRNLRAKKISFDGYGSNVEARARDSPFFSGPQTIQIGNKTLRIERKDNNSISLNFEDVCSTNQLLFCSYSLTFEDYLQKLREAAQIDRDVIWISIDVLRSKSCNCMRCRNNQSDDCEALRDAFVNGESLSFIVAVQFNLDEVRTALTKYDGTTLALSDNTLNNTHNNTGGTTMSILGMNFTFGMNKDPNVKSTLWGIAVREGEGSPWHSYDTRTNKWRNLTNKDFGSFPVMFFPKRKEQIVPNDVIQNGKDWLTIKEVTPGGTFKAVSNLTGTVVETLPEESLVAGLSFYTTAVPIVDMLHMTDPNGNNQMSGLLGAMVIMRMAKPKKAKRTATYTYDSLNREIQEDKEGIFGDLSQLWPLIYASNSAAIQDSPFLALMAMNDDDDPEQKDMLEMLFATQFLGGGNGANAQNPFAAFGMGPTAPAAGAATGEKVVCSKCGTELLPTAKFCNKCGGPAQHIMPNTTMTAEKCPNCGADLQPNAKFCNACGANVEAKTCPNCGKKLRRGAKFCDQCGASTEAPVCPKCSKELPFGAKFCDGCGASLLSTTFDPAPTTAKCPKCGAEQPLDAKFCNVCGASMAPDPVPAAPADKT